MQKRLLKYLKEQIGKECYLCGKIFTLDDFNEIEELQIDCSVDEIFNEYDGAKPICRDCYYAYFFEKRYFSGNYNLLHPN